MTKLKQHLFMSGITQREFAAGLGIGENRMSEIVSGRRKPNLPLAIKIEDATKGAVTVRDLV